WVPRLQRAPVRVHVFLPLLPEISDERFRCSAGMGAQPARPLETCTLRPNTPVGHEHARRARACALKRSVAPRIVRHDSDCIESRTVLLQKKCGATLDINV